MPRVSSSGGGGGGSSPPSQLNGKGKKEKEGEGESVYFWCYDIILVRLAIQFLKGQ